MGVHALWDVVGPTARPVRLESLSSRRLAVDASIWIYQFLKAVRDKQGNAMRFSHIVGFFRRICKLLYFGIKPVFVFDGGAPALKRRTIQERKERRQGRRDNAASTAKRLLALQMHTGKVPEQSSSQNEAGNERVHIFRPNDDYHLPEIPGFKVEKNDSRLNIEEQDIKTLMDGIDDLEGIDLDTINPASKEFDELPSSTQYMILSALRLKSRLRMGYSKEQLENIYPDSMDFSKFQIDMVKRRNFFTQKLMNVTGMHDGGAGRMDDHSVRRVAGQRGKEYELIRTENGWVLSLEGKDGSEVRKAIELDEPSRTTHKDNESLQASKESGGDEFDDVEWEDVQTEKKDRRDRTDYSIKASLLPPLGALSEVGGNQAFLDRRHNSPEAINRKNEVIFIENEPAKNDETDDSDDDFTVFSRDVNLMNSMKAKEPAQENAKTANFPQLNSTIDDLCPKDSPNDSLKLREGNLEAIRPKISPQNHLSKSKGISEVKDNAPVALPTESEQTLQFIVNRISPEEGQPALRETSSKNSVNLEGKDKIALDSSVEENETQRPILDSPEWFKTSSTFSVNPHLGTSFLTLPVDNNLAKESENESLFANSRARELMKAYEEEESGERNSDKDELEILSVSPSPRASDDIQPKPDTNAPSPESKNSSVIDYDFSEDEENALVEQLRQEEQDYHQFKTVLNPITSNLSPLENDLDALNDQQMKDKRDSDEVTLAMVKEVQDLLSRFGIPYLTAPMEAEAQCAELLRLNLVDGIITDDSDVFLFGGNKVYKNMFQEKNYVEFYHDDVIRKDLGLEREKFIELAQLLGSDYTNGVKSVGPVTAMEILADFGDLSSFREWYNEGQFHQKKQKNEPTFRKNLRKRLVANEVVLDNDFPSELVKEAYLRPEVDHDTTKFTWGVPDLDRLRNYFQITVGWPQEKTDEVLVPLIREMNDRKKHGIQNTITNFFPTEFIRAEKELKLGKRIKNASGKLKNKRQKK
ncbi:LAMI_0F15258g1_1 [Lachancea mirantina]|uniref:LAMI_0F15258g1_1 n=1 Tax=Lachancea mirantina TaxID=1230905 RepID=A0A1G4K492_9SACH|nr:LAMI_0F15258g1_1 [Lachancea mirantina]